MMLGPAGTALADGTCPNGWSNLDCQAVNNDWVNWVPLTCADSSGTTILPGTDNVDKAYNYFIGKGLNPMITAAVVGNLVEESRLVPTIVQSPPGGNTQDPSWIVAPKYAQTGWGIAQWTPGAKIIDIAKSLNITGPIYDLATQLDIVWAEMTGTAPTGAQAMVNGLKQQTTLADAVQYFQIHFESGSNFQARLQAAQQVAANHHNGSGGGTQGGGTPNTGPSCPGSGGTGITGQCDSPAPTGGYSTIQAAIAGKFKVNIQGDTSVDWATQTYNTLCALAKAPAYYSKLIAKGPITITFDAGGCSGGFTSATKGITMFGFCDPDYNRFLLSHELGHMYAFRNNDMYQQFNSQVWGHYPTLPTYNCQFDYGVGPFEAECWADMIGEYLVYFDIRDTVGGRPAGTHDFKQYPTQYAGYYNFARDHLFGGVEYKSF